MTEIAHSPVERTPRSYRGAVVVFFIAVAVRVAFGLFSHQSSDATSLVFDDERWYWELGESYAQGDGFVGEFGHRSERMPLYPWFLSWFAGAENGPAMARGAQWLLGSLAASLTYLLARSVGATPLVAGLIVALDPALTGSTSLLLTEALHVTLVAGLWLLGWPLVSGRSRHAGRWLAVVAVGCCALYLRESSLALIVAFFVLVAGARRDRFAIVASAASLALVVCSLVPWAYRNHTVLGEWYWLTTRGGISLYDGVRPGATGAGDLADVKNAPEVQGLSETEWDHHFRSASRRAIVDDPWRIASLAPGKLARTWSPVLHAQEYGSRTVRLVFAAWYIPLYALAILGIVATRRRLTVLAYLLLPIVVVCLLHAVFVGSVRYRLPAIPVLAILAAFGLSAIVSYFRARRATN